MKQLEYFLSRTVKEPVYGTPGSAGIDFFIPEFDNKFIEDLEDKNLQSTFSIDEVKKEILLLPHNRILIPSGVYMKLPKETALVAFNKSGISTKKGLDILAAVVDFDYEGEIHISLLNTGENVVKLKENEKIVQFILLTIPATHLIKIHSREELYKDSNSKRGDGGFGSTN